MTLVQWIMAGFALGYAARGFDASALPWCGAVFMAELTKHCPQPYQDRYGCNLWYGAYCSTLIVCAFGRWLWLKHTAPLKLRA